MEISQDEARQILSAHKVHHSLEDERSERVLAAQIALTGTVSIEDYRTHKGLILECLWPTYNSAK
jgi:hypothetical protein